MHCTDIHVLGLRRDVARTLQEHRVILLLLLKLLNHLTEFIVRDWLHTATLPQQMLVSLCVLSKKTSEPLVARFQTS